MAKKRIAAVVKVQVPAGQATPAPPVGPALGPHGVSAPMFVQQFNERTKGLEPGLTTPVEITIYADKTFTFVTKTPPAAVLIRKVCGSGEGLGGTEQGKGGLHHTRAVAGDRSDQAPRPQRHRR